MIFKEANGQFQPVSIIPKVDFLQQESPVSLTVEHFALDDEGLGLGFAYLLLASLTFHHCCCCSLPHNKRKEDPEILHPICLGIRQVHSSQDVKLSATIFQTQPPVSFQGSQYLLVRTSPYSRAFILCCTSDSSAPVLHHSPFELQCYLEFGEQVAVILENCRAKQ